MPKSKRRRTRRIERAPQLPSQKKTSGAGARQPAIGTRGTFPAIVKVFQFAIPAVGLIAAIIAILTYRPKISVLPEIDPDPNTGILGSFSITNSGNIDLTALSAGLGMCYWITKNHTIFRNIDNKTDHDHLIDCKLPVGTKLVDPVTYGGKILAPQDHFSFDQTFGVHPPDLSAAEVSVAVSYRPTILGVKLPQKNEEFLFRTSPTSDGKLRWTELPTPNTPDS